MVSEHPDVLTMSDSLSVMGEEMEEDGVREMDVSVREVWVREKREWEREEDWIMNAMDDKVMFSQCRIVNRTSVVLLLTPFITLSELLSPPFPSIKDDLR